MNSRNLLALKKVDIHRFMGVTDARYGLLIPEQGEFAPGINVVLGPNASGKTTTGRAVHELLWPGENGAGGMQASMTGKWDIDGQTLETVIEAGRPKWCRNGSKVSPPPLPPIAHRRRYWLALDELLQVEDRDLAEAVRNEVFGGLDLQSAARALGFESRIPKINIKPYQRYRDANAQVAKLTRSQLDLKNEEEDLKKLQEALAAAESARQSSILFQKISEYLEAAENLQDIREQWAGFDNRLAKFHGNEVERYEEARCRLEENRQAQRDIRAALNKARHQLKQVGCTSETCPSQEDIRRLKAVLQSLRQLENDLSQSRRQLAAFKEEEAGLLKSIGEVNKYNVPPEKLAKLDVAIVQRLTNMARQAQDLTAEAAAAARFRNLLQTENSDANKKMDIERGIALLAEWLLTAPVMASREDEFSRRLVLVLSGFGIALAAGLGWFVNPWWLLAASFPAVVAGWNLLRQPNRRLKEEKNRIEREYADHDLTGPMAWNEPEVRKTICRLAEDLAEANVSIKQADARRAQDIRDKELEERKCTLQKQARELADQTGVAIKIEEPAIVYILDRLINWQRARDTRVREQGRVQSLADDRQKLMQTANQGLQACGTKAVSDIYQLEAALETIDQMSIAYREARREVENAERRQKELEEEGDAIFKKLNIFLERIGITPIGQSAPYEDLIIRQDEVANLQRDYNNYRETCIKLQTCELDLKSRKEGLHKRPDFKDDFLTLSSDRVRQKLTELERQAADCDSLREKIAKLEGRVTDARKQDILEAALAERDEARAELREIRDDAAAAMAGDIVLRYIEKTHRKYASPLLDTAGKCLSRITRGRWKLSVRTLEDGSTEFIAEDGQTEKQHNLNELSSGTRVQLLLAIRLAFVENLEGEYAHLPLILDETLSNSDRERSAAAMEALLEIAREGRQIIYFTAREDEVRRWLKMFGDGTGLKLSEAGPGVVWKGEARIRPAEPESPEAADEKLKCAVIFMRGDRLAVDETFNQSVMLPEISAAANVQAPGSGISYEEYGRMLNVPSWNPLDAERGNIHLWYLLQDKHELYSLMEAGYFFWNQLAMLLDQEGSGALRALGLEAPERLATRARAAAAILKKAAALQTIGRNRRMSRDDLYQSPVRNSKYIDQVADQLDQQDGNPEALLKALEEKAVSGFGAKMITRLEAYLEDEGILDHRPPLSDNEFRAALDAFASKVSSQAEVSRYAALIVRERLNFSWDNKNNCQYH